MDKTKRMFWASSWMKNKLKNEKQKTQQHQLKPNKDSSAIAYVDEMDPYGTHWDWTFFFPFLLYVEIKIEED